MCIPISSLFHCQNLRIKSDFFCVLSHPARVKRRKMAGTRSKADGRDNGGGGGFVCTHCGSCLSNLHEKISGADLILHHPCEECGMVADAYSEFSVTLVLIDVVLLRVCC